MAGDAAHIEELKNKALALPNLPGVYIMKSASEEVIYVGKAKILKNRVTQYFRNTASHTPKTRSMVEHVNTFDIIVTTTEFEALVLENSLIKRHRPKYNILLKDDKGYPFIRLSVRDRFPVFSIVSKPAEDGAHYYGPYGGRGAAKLAINTILETLKLPTCSRRFPRDIGRERPCLNRHLNRCLAPCDGSLSEEGYRALIGEAEQLLQGSYQTLADSISAQMEEAAEALEFERAALLRDRLKAVEQIGRHQKVVAGALADTDVIAFHQGQVRACVTVLHYIAGTLLEKEVSLFDGCSVDDSGEVLESFLKQYYSRRKIVPKNVLLSQELDDMDLIAAWLEDICGKKPKIFRPQRAEKLRLVEMALENAADEVRRAETAQERVSKSLSLLSEKLGIGHAVSRMEAFDISNTAGSEVVAGMVVFQDARPVKSAYRRFKIKTVAGQDDPACIHEAVSRRVRHFVEGDTKFTPLPDVLMIDGGITQTRAAQRALSEQGVDVPVFGMVKDDHHRTRALIAPDGREIGIVGIPALFSLIGRMQEEVHRYSIEYHRALRAKRGYGLTLDEIPGVGATRRQALIRAFKTVENVKNASFEALCEVVPQNVARAIRAYYDQK
mgnify:CR=1 FL=1